MDNFLKNIKIFDTTLRDGEQSPGCAMHLSDKLKLAAQLEKLGVSVIEAGFAAASKGDFEAIQNISKVIKNTTIASLARALPQDIDLAYEALRQAAAPRLHTFIATSPLHMAYKLRRTPEQVIDITRTMVAYAKKYLSDIEFSLEDATRSDPAFLARVIDAAILAGATTINIPDTVGYTTPLEYAALIQGLLNTSHHLHKVELSVHCHNDLGMAVANSLAAIQAGATQVECTVNGIGERAGNAALEEIVMAMHTRQHYFKCQTSIVTPEIINTSRILASITGIGISPTKPIVGANAFAHESGIHQHGILAHPGTYEIMTPESIGLQKPHMAVGKHSGKHGFKEHVSLLGFQLDEAALSSTFDAFKSLCDKKKRVYDEDILALILNEQHHPLAEYYKLSSFVISSTSSHASATIHLTDAQGHEHIAISKGHGPIDAAYNAIQVALKENVLDGQPHLSDVLLDHYHIRSVTQGDDALGEAAVRLVCNHQSYSGIGLSTDILEASILAYLQALNRIIAHSSHELGGKEPCTA